MSEDIRPPPFSFCTTVPVYVISDAKLPCLLTEARQDDHQAMDIILYTTQTAKGFFGRLRNTIQKLGCRALASKLCEDLNEPVLYN